MFFNLCFSHMKYYRIYKRLSMGVFFICVHVSFIFSLQAEVVVETDSFKMGMDDAGGITQFVDKATGRDYLDKAKKIPFAVLKGENQSFPVKAVRYEGAVLTADFGAVAGQVVFHVVTGPQRIVFEVRSVSWDKAEEISYAEIPLTLKGTFEDAFAVTPLALDLKTNCNQIPGLCSKVSGFIVYKRFGFEGTKGALIAGPMDNIRNALKDAIKSSPELPQSDIGGPWALDAKVNQGSYLISTSEYVTEETVSQWIEVAKSVGATQIDFHGGHPFRWGDFEVNPELYPRGRDSLKTVIDTIHQAGLYAGLHTYSFFIDKKTPWVTPVPDTRLASDKTFTLAEDLEAGDSRVIVEESTEAMSAITGFFVRNSATLRIDDELIIYKDVQKSAPFTFVECERGAYGTKVSAHKKGAKVHHLKECFGLFVPDVNSTLFTEVIQRTADLYNYCGFDMVYLDALDGSDVLGGWENTWHYSAKFVYELIRRLNKSPIMEMSTFSHHLWCVRSRMGAWDCPMRGKKEFVDYHIVSNRQWKYSFLPTNLGWWGIFDWDGVQPERSMSDEFEYICAKALATNSSLSYVVGFTPKNLNSDKFQRFAKIARKYEELRMKNIVPESIKEKLIEPGAEFTLDVDENGQYQFRPVTYIKHKINLNDTSNSFSVNNPYASQPLKMRIEALLETEEEDHPDAKLLANFRVENEFSKAETQKGVSATLEYPLEKAEDSKLKAILRAENVDAEQERSWAVFRKDIQNMVDFSTRGLGVWIKGDGQGEVLNFQIASPKHLIGGFADHYVTVDFTGWRYFELVEPESYQLSRYEWQHTRMRKDFFSGSSDIMSFAYPMYHYWVNFKSIATLTIGVNNIPVGKKVEVGLGPISAIPFKSVKIENPSVQIGDIILTFPIEIKSGSYIEFVSKDNCKLYNEKGEFVRDIIPEGEIPQLQHGENSVIFRGDKFHKYNCRFDITIISEGMPLSM
ncbi:MAG TPA: hypothetical protein PLJ10_11605 [Candidatus Hydrogenedens sp.]|nr:hypothetical protein [Candidatus Hydrogenedens sp.]